MLEISASESTAPEYRLKNIFQEILAMSSRALRRLENSRVLQNSGGDAVDEATSESERELVHSAPKVNAFALLGEESEVSEQSDEEGLDNNVTNEVDAKEEEVKATNSKKGKRRGKGKGKKKPDTDDIEDEDLDRFLEEVRKRDQQAVQSVLPDIEEDSDGEQPYDLEDPPVWYDDSNYLYFTTSRLKQSLPLLSIGAVKNLDPDTELKNLFGNLSLETIEDANSTTSLATSPEVLAQIKKLARLTRGWGGKDHRSVPGTARKLLLTRIKEDWVPTAQKPLAMEEMTMEDIENCLVYKKEDEEYSAIESKIKNEERLGIRYFRFFKIPSVGERVANSRFYASVVMTPDPESLMQLLQQHPYHVETLLQVAMVMLRQGNNKATSNALVEKCLFVFDRSFNKRFHEMLQDGKNELIRLPYESFMNRQFYLCLFRVITGLAERSTFYTALCYCKLLLSMSPAEDPLGVRYFLDHYAILSDEYQYLVKFVNSPLGQTYGKWYTPGLAYSEVLAHLSLGDTGAAKTALSRAFTAHPYCGVKLFETVGLGTEVKLDGEKDAFAEVAAETYLVRAGLLWKEQAHRQFLHDELLVLIGQRKSSGKSWFSRLLISETKHEQLIPLNLIRFAILSGENKVLAKLPESVFEQDNVLEYDVLPPTDNAAGYDVYSGVQGTSKVTDSLFDYLDHNMISAIVQNRTEENIEQLIAQFGQEGVEDAVE